MKNLDEERQEIRQGWEIKEEERDGKWRGNKRGRNHKHGIVSKLDVFDA